MEQKIYIQLKGLDKQIQVEADKITRQAVSDGAGLPLDRGIQQFLLTKGDKIVGEFDTESVAGWWLGDSM